MVKVKKTDKKIADIIALFAEALWCNGCWAVLCVCVTNQPNWSLDYNQAQNSTLVKETSKKKL